MLQPVWVQGWQVGQTTHPAQLLGLTDAPTFPEACAQLLEPLGNFDAVTLTYWGRPLFDNEAAARALYG
jgi:hypothetical protein